MTSRSNISFAERAESHSHPLVHQLFALAEQKQSNLTLSADVTTSRELLDIADRVGPHIVVLKTHIDIVADLTPETLKELVDLAQKHNFFIFEDRKFVDIGSTVQKQYHGGALRISEWANIVNIAVLAGEGIVEAFEQLLYPAKKPSEVQDLTNRGVLILAEMTSKGSLATGDYTARSVDMARNHPGTIIGFVATQALTEVGSTAASCPAAADEDFVVFTTGINLGSKGDNLGQQYNTPASAVARGADIIIVGRGIYAAPDPVQTAKEYQKAGWEAYLARIGQ